MTIMDPSRMTREELAALGRVLVWISKPQWVDYGEKEHGWFTANYDEVGWRIGLYRIEEYGYVKDEDVTAITPLPPGPMA